MEGYELDRFVNPVDEGFICGFCNRVFRNPLFCLACTNTYCGECVSKNLQAAEKCPTQTCISNDTFAPIPN